MFGKGTQLEHKIPRLCGRLAHSVSFTVLFSLYDLEQCSQDQQPSPEQIELRLIQSKEDIESPPPLQHVLGTAIQ